MKKYPRHGYTSFLKMIIFLNNIAVLFKGYVAWYILTCTIWP